MYVLKYSILNSFSQNPAISTFFRKVHSDERELAGQQTSQFPPSQFKGATGS